MQRNINPYAIANISGSNEYSKIKGVAELYSIENGTLFKVEIKGLPNENKNNFFGFHIHENAKCESTRNSYAV